MSQDLSPSSMSPAELRDAKEELDPELLALPDPPKSGRTLTIVVLALAALASLAMVFALRRDVVYAFAPSTPTDLGDLRTAALNADLENHHVSGRAMLGAAGAILYERPFTDDTFRALPVAGRSDVWAEVRVPAGKENGRWEPPRTVAGRLVRFDAAGPRHRGLRAAIEAATHAPVADGAWLIVDGDGPSSARWSVALTLLFFAFACWNVMTIVRLVRRVR